MKDFKVYYAKSNRYVCEKHMQLLPAIEYFNEMYGHHRLLSFRFILWRYWFKISFSWEI